MSNKVISRDTTFSIKTETVFGAAADRRFMLKALAQAKRAAKKNEVPVGAIVVDPQGAIIGRGYNQVEAKGCQAAHAEVHAIAKASRFLDNWRLSGCYLYVTLEPCVMCIGLIMNSRLAGVIYATDSPLFGYHLDNHIASWVYKKNAFWVVRHELPQARALLKDFFIQKREFRNASKNQRRCC
jgi:tRNA(adenine34) deaminase